MSFIWEKNNYNYNFTINNDNDKKNDIMKKFFVEGIFY